MQDAGWDPTSLCVPNGYLVPPPLLIDDSITFAEGKDLIIDVPVDVTGTADVYIDDTREVCKAQRDFQRVLQEYRRRRV